MEQAIFAARRKEIEKNINGGMTVTKTIGNLKALGCSVKPIHGTGVSQLHSLWGLYSTTTQAEAADHDAQVREAAAAAASARKSKKPSDNETTLKTALELARRKKKKNNLGSEHYTKPDESHSADSDSPSKSAENKKPSCYKCGAEHPRCQHVCHKCGSPCCGPVAGCSVMVEGDSRTAYFCEHCFPKILKKNPKALKVQRIGGKVPKEPKMYTSTVDIENLIA